MNFAFTKHHLFSQNHRLIHESLHNKKELFNNLLLLINDSSY